MTVAQHSNAAFGLFAGSESCATPSVVTSFRDDAVGPGIQTVWVMPWEGVDADCVWIDPALA